MLSWTKGKAPKHPLTGMPHKPYPHGNDDVDGIGHSRNAAVPWPHASSEPRRGRQLRIALAQACRNSQLTNVNSSRWDPAFLGGGGGRGCRVTEGKHRKPGNKDQEENCSRPWYTEEPSVNSPRALAPRTSSLADLTAQSRVSCVVAGSVTSVKIQCRQERIRHNDRMPSLTP